MVSIIATVIFLRFWKPKKIWRFDYDDQDRASFLRPREKSLTTSEASGRREDFDGHVQVRSYPLGKVLKAWMPFAILSVFVLLWGLPPVKLAMNQATTPAFKVVLAGWQGPTRPAGLGRALSAQCGLSRRARGGQADSRSRAL